LKLVYIQEWKMGKMDDMGMWRKYVNVSTDGEFQPRSGTGQSQAKEHIHYVTKPGVILLISVPRA
jgi:hypothetical protein